MLTIVVMFSLVLGLSSFIACSQDDDTCVTSSTTFVDSKSYESSINNHINYSGNNNNEDVFATNSDYCSGPGGSYINLTGNDVLSQGKHIISLSVVSNSNWLYGFSYLVHQSSPFNTGDVYWRVVKRRDNWFADDDYEVFHDCTLLTPNVSIDFLFTTADINTGSEPWTDIQLEIVVIGGSARVAWTGYSGQSY